MCASKVFAGNIFGEAYWRLPMTCGRGGQGPREYNAGNRFEKMNAVSFCSN